MNCSTNRENSWLTGNFHPIQIQKGQTRAEQVIQVNQNRVMWIRWASSDPFIDVSTRLELIYGVPLNVLNGLHARSFHCALNWNYYLLGGLWFPASRSLLAASTHCWARHDRVRAEQVHSRSRTHKSLLLPMNPMNRISARVAFVGSLKPIGTFKLFLLVTSRSSRWSSFTRVTVGDKWSLR